MRSIEYSLKLKSPVILTYSSSDENTVQSRDYIPGYVILGALASHYLRNNKHDELFNTLFLSNQVNYMDATIAKKTSQRSFKAPMAIQKEKSSEKYHFMPLTESSLNTSPIASYLLKTENGYEKLTPEKGIHFHINTTIKEKEEEGGIFHYEYLKSGQYFKGHIKCEDHLYHELTTFLNTLQTLSIGRSKNTEYGKVTFSYREQIPQTISMNRQTITFFFKSPVILRNENGFYEPSLKQLDKELNLDTPHEITHQFIRTMEIENYRRIWGMKTPNVKAMQPGSTFTLRFLENPSESTLKTIQNHLEQGMGCRKNEGFGEIAILDINEEICSINSQEKEKQGHQKPEYTPEFMKNVINKITEKQILKEIDEKVIRDGEAIKKRNVKMIPTNSLLSKMEMMVKDSESFEVFKTNKLKPLRNHATKQLEKCRTTSGTLYQILNGEKTIQYDFSDVRDYLPDIEQQSKQFKYTQRYLSGLMRRLRKINKEQKKDGE